jgi:hypothetical protein
MHVCDVHARPLFPTQRRGTLSSHGSPHFPHVPVLDAQVNQRDADTRQLRYQGPILMGVPGEH